MALNNSLKCSTPADVFLLLKSSDFVSHDLGNPYVAFRDSDDNRIVPRTVVPDDPPEQLYLILRKWIEIEPSLEFRCFVRERRLVGISQRDTFNYYPFLPAMKEEVQPAIESLWQDVVLPNFDETNCENRGTLRSRSHPDACEPVTFDVYLSRRSAGLKALVVDFNPFAYYTDALLFDWDELAGWQTDAPMEFRIIESDEHARACSRGWANPKFSSSRLPLDASIPPDSREIAEAADILS